MNVASSQTNLANSGLWHSLSCNWIWGVVLFICCLLMSINAASSTAPQHAYPLIQTLPQPATSVIIRPQLQREQKPVRPQIQQPKAPGDKKIDLDGVT
ncbi:MAG: hypothetical protein P4L53_05050 [Candidatus Obscuribacterales bacterium]|nr:hypothetical protein [Candidatus Obscuribacterales bacterium]